MNTTSLHIQIEPAIKLQAQKTADELGLSLSSVVKALLKQFIRTKRLSIGITEILEIPNAQTVKDFKTIRRGYQSRKDTKIRIMGRSS